LPFDVRVDAPHGVAKFPVLPNYICVDEPHHTVLRNFEGLMVSYPEPAHLRNSRVLGDERGSAKPSPISPLHIG